MTFMNPMLCIDGYKLDHRRQYPVGTRRVYSNWTPRSSRIKDSNKVVVFGLQYFLQEYLMERMQEYFFDRPLKEVVQEYKEFCDNYVPGNAIGTDHIADLHQLGYIPLEFRALPEGTLCPIGVPCVTIENTKDEFFWLTNYIETIMSSCLFMPMTSATTAHLYKKMMIYYANRTGGDLEFVPWQGHDFSMRGMPGLEAAMLSGAGHLLSFYGTDTVPAIQFLKKYYDAQGLIGGSVPATEHAVMCSHGMNEIETFEYLLDLYPEGIVSIVSDTWNLWDVLTNVLPKLTDKILARKGKVVIRPDSGDPVKILLGDPHASMSSPQNLGVINLLARLFGTTICKGYRSLDPHIGVIYGDSITPDRCDQILSGLQGKGMASTNIVLGIGSYTYQYITRDTYGFAMKATWADINGEPHALFKKPITDDGGKNSARGRLAVIDTDQGLSLIQGVTPEVERTISRLTPVWRDGKWSRRDSLTTIRERLNKECR